MRVKRVEFLVWVKSTGTLLWLHPPRAPLVRLAAARVLEGKALCLFGAWKQEEIVKCAPANRNASAPFGTLLSVKKLNYTVCKNSLGASLPFLYSPACTSFVKTKY